MPSPQSASLAHGPGTHERYSTGSPQSHSAPAGQAHALPPVTGFLRIGAGGTTGTLGTGAVTNNATLQINRSNAITVGNTISGSGTLNQAGAGTTSLDELMRVVDLTDRMT